MCPIGPWHNTACLLKRTFRDEYYFNRYAIFCNTWHSLFYLIPRRNTNIFCPGLSRKTQNTDFLRNGTQNENLAPMMREKKSFSFVLCQVSLINLLYCFVNSIFPSTPYTWFQKSWFLAQKCNLIWLFCAKMEENGIFSPK